MFSGALSFLDKENSHRTSKFCLFIRALLVRSAQREKLFSEISIIKVTGSRMARESRSFVFRLER